MAGKEKQVREVSHPVTNGTTKKMIFFAMILLGLSGTLALIFLFIGAFFFSSISLWLFKGAMLTIATANFGGLIYAIHSFFDTRESAQKAADKLAKYKVKMGYKLDKYRIKNKKEG